MTVPARMGWTFPGGFVTIGHPEDHELPAHGRVARAFQLGGARHPEHPLVDLGVFRRLCAAGLWDAAMRRRPGQLRDPQQILKLLPAGANDATLLMDLTKAEAVAIAGASGGRLPDETEMDRLLRANKDVFSRFPSGIPLWTASLWSDWSYRLVVPDQHASGWRALPGRRLPDLQANAPACLFIVGSPVQRKPAATDQTAGCVVIRDWEG